MYKQITCGFKNVIHVCSNLAKMYLKIKFIIQISASIDALTCLKCKFNMVSEI